MPRETLRPASLRLWSGPLRGGYLSLAAQHGRGGSGLLFSFSKHCPRLVVQAMHIFQLCGCSPAVGCVVRHCRRHVSPIDILHTLALFHCCVVPFAQPGPVRRVTPRGTAARRLADLVLPRRHPADRSRSRESSAYAFAVRPPRRDLANTRFVLKNFISVS